MSRYSAVSDLDYLNESDGPHGQYVERTCACCKESFSMLVDGAYVLRVWCPNCQAEACAKARKEVA